MSSFLSEIKVEHNTDCIFVYVPYHKNYEILIPG